MFDLKTAADRMKHEILRKEVCDEEEKDDDEEDADGDRDARHKSSSPPATVTTANAPIGAGASASPAGAATAKGLRIEEPKESSRSSPIRSDSGKLPRLRGGEKKEPRAKFTVSLSRKEIEDDFMAMIGHRPARRPKKRPRIVQKQMDTLFPGLWLGEVTVDSYKVPEIPDIGKR
ncbi:unnamed protein product [Linum tenue]|uniref:DUF1639 family protein n=1 Tax=Linum tenue TaxID=586396 RepID=A0AAV0N7X2_9ROSI|nr:unnamed protein product [Linum tenue]